MKSTKTLNNLGILVTRPAHQAEPLCRLITQHGGIPIRFPALEIANVEDTRRLHRQIQQLDKFDIAIFISPNAVNKAISLIKSIGKWPNQIKIAAVGKSSAKALDSSGLIADIFPSLRFNSEALLDLEEMHEVKGKSIIIFRGEGGRELLADTLKNRGAKVEYAECYRRRRPNADTSQIIEQWVNGKIKLVICTSNESLLNLHDMLNPLGRQCLLNTAMVVFSERAANLAMQLGFKSRPLVTKQASDDEILNSILIWSKMHEA